MFLQRLGPRVSCAAFAAALLTACAQHAGALVPSTLPASGISGLSPSVMLPDATPPKCKGQKTSQKFASLTVTLKTTGGSFCVPAFGGFGGTIKYPDANPSVKLGLISSTTNYAKLPELGPGKAIFYLQLALSGGTSFGSNSTAGGGLTAKKLVPGKPYSAYGQATAFGISTKFGPCYAVAGKGKYGGVIGGIGTLLKGVSIPVAADGVIEVYSGKNGSKC